MTESNDLAYLVARERLSREMSTEPADAAVQRAHLDLANAYAARIVVVSKS